MIKMVTRFSHSWKSQLRIIKRLLKQSWGWYEAIKSLIQFYHYRNWRSLIRIISYEGVSCAGPCSVEALKRGEIYLRFEGQLMFSEMYNNQYHWVLMDNGAWRTTVTHNLWVISFAQIVSLILCSNSLPHRHGVRKWLSFMEWCWISNSALVHLSECQSQQI